MYRRRALEIGASGVAIGLAGCLGGGLGDGTNGASERTETATVTMSGTDFDPRTVRIETAGTVTWTNEGSGEHTVEAATVTEAGVSWMFGSDRIGPGDSVTNTFSDPGAFEYVCTVHGESTMCGVVLVGDTAYDATLPCEDDTGGGGYY